MAGVAAAGLRAGLVAAVLSGVPSALVWPFGGSDPLQATREIGRFVLRRPSLLSGAVSHLGFSLLFALPGPWLARAPRPAVAGLLYGLALYGVNFRLLAPRRWPEIRRHDGLAQVGDHLVFGAAVAQFCARDGVPQ